MDTPTLLVTVAQAAQATSLSRSRIYELISEGRIETVKIGASRRIPVEALRDFVEALRAG